MPIRVGTFDRRTTRARLTSARFLASMWTRRWCRQNPRQELRRRLQPRLRLLTKRFASESPNYSLGRSSIFDRFFVIYWRDDPSWSEALKFAPVLLLIASLLCSASFAQTSPLSLEYRVEWRLIDAGKAYLKWNPGHGKGGQTNIHLETEGLVNTLFPVKDDYSSNLDEMGCTLSTLMRAQESSRRRETLVTYDRIGQKVQYQEKDLVKGQVVNLELAIPGCTYDVIGALVDLRRQKLDPGMVLTVPVSDGKKFVNAKVEVQARETVKTPAGEFKAIRLEAMLFDGVLYQRKARLYIWFSDDARRIPVQIRVALRFYIGTITLQLQKQE